MPDSGIHQEYSQHLTGKTTVGGEELLGKPYLGVLCANSSQQ